MNPASAPPEEAVALTPRAPVIAQAVNSQLDPADCPDGATVVIGTDGVAQAGDVIVLQWHGLTATGDSRPYTQQQSTTLYDVGRSIAFVPAVPLEHITELAGGSLGISYQVIPANGTPTRQSHTTTLPITTTTATTQTLFIAGQRSTTFAYDASATSYARAKIQTLMGFTRPAGHAAVAPIPRSLTWQYDGDTQAQVGKYFVDTNPERAIIVSVPGDTTIAGIVLAPCGVAQTPERDAIVLRTGEAWIWNTADRTQLAPQAGRVAGTGSTRALALIEQDGAVNGYGDPALCDGLPALQNVESMAATAQAFATLSTAGIVTQLGQTSGSAKPASLPPVKSIVATWQAFCAVARSGAIAAWGAEQSGGADVPSLPSGVACVGAVPTLGAFGALLDNGAAVTWGDDNYGAGAPKNLNNVVSLAATAYAFAALKNDGTVTAWGLPAAGGTAPAGLANAVLLASAWDAFAALRHDGTVVAWGSDELVKTLPQSLDNVVSLTGAERAFAALSADGTVVVWGRAAQPGGSDPSTWRDIVAIQSAGETLYAIGASGDVYAWGSNAAHMPPSFVLDAMQNQFSFSRSQGR